VKGNSVAKINHKIIQLEPDVAVAPQLVEADFAEIARFGFRSVVANRPDGEAPDQLPHAQAEAAARRQGLEFRYFPVKGANATDDEVVEAFAQMIDALPRPLLFYCGSSTRSAVLWSQVAAPRLGVDEVLSIAREAGYDLDVLRDALEARADWAGPRHVAQPASSLTASPAR
jgi:sulfide:quinone oxidoreductase